jgi:cobalt-zinc-cadmium efflux system outer membrane protein
MTKLRARLAPCAVAAAGAGLALAGCASAPTASLPEVRSAVASRSGLTVDWPQDEAARRARDEAVRGLLAADLTPDSAVKVALLNSRRLQAILEELGVAQADLWSAGRLRNPTFFASARWPAGGKGASDVEWSLTAEVLEDFLIPLRQRVARAQVAAAESRVAQAALDLAAEVRTAAYELAARQEVRRRLAAIADVGHLAGEFARRQSEAGDINRLDLEVQQAAAEQARLELVRIDAQLQADRERLNGLLGLVPPATGWTMSAELPPLPAADRLPEDLEARARGQRLDLAAADARVASARAAFDLRRRTRLSPAAVDLGVDSERNPDGSRVTGPTLQLGLPIFDQGQGDLARLGAELRQAEDQRDALAAGIGAEVRTARAALLAARTVADAYGQTVLPLRRRILRETQLNYNAMQRSTYELLAARAADLAAEREGVDALRDYWLARVQLERAAGGRLPGPEPAPGPGS